MAKIITKIGGVVSAIAGTIVSIAGIIGATCISCVPICGVVCGGSIALLGVGIAGFLYKHSILFIILGGLLFVFGIILMLRKKKGICECSDSKGGDGYVQK